MREVSFVGECSIDLSKLDQPLNGKCAYLGQNLFNDKQNEEDVEWQLVIGGVEGDLIIVESSGNSLSHFPIQRSNEEKIDFGFICKINSIYLNEKRWITVLSHCGMLKFVAMARNRPTSSGSENTAVHRAQPEHRGSTGSYKIPEGDVIPFLIPEKIVEYQINLNAVDFDINELDSQILIKFQSGTYSLFSYRPHPDRPVQVDHVCKWDFNAEFDSFLKSGLLGVSDLSVSRFQSSNISRMTYKKSPKAFFCVVLNLLSDDEQLERQLLAYFDAVTKNIIFEPIESPSNKGPIKVKLRRPPIFQGHLKAEKRFACITQQCQLSALFLEDSKSDGPILTSFLSRNDIKELVLSKKDSSLPQVQENSEIVGFSKLDVLSDDNEEVVICNATGLTYILSSKTNQEIIRYHHRKGIKYFTCGILGSKPCFIYITSWNTLEVFSNVQLPYFNKRCILEAVEESTVIKEYFRSKNATEKIQKRDIIRNLLYA